MIIDKISLERIKKLHPLVRDEVFEIMLECKTALTGKAEVRITQGLRTFEEQQKLYNQRPKVTNAKAGQSVHNYGFAVDICLIIDGKVASWDTAKDWDNDKIADWYEVVKIFAKYGWEWGGNWKNFKDMPHFEKKGFNDWRKLQTYKRDSLGYVII